MTQIEKQKIDDLRREVDRICEGKGSFQDATEFRDFRAYEPAPADTRLSVVSDDKGPFGQWLVQQKAANEAMHLLIDCAKRDPHFPLEGDPEDVRARLRACMAEGDLFDALDDAELDWLSH